MEIKIEKAEPEYLDEQRHPLLKDTTVPAGSESEQNSKTTPDNEQKTLIQKAISQTFKSTAHLANLLPTGTVLAFQLLAPILTNQGQCDIVGRYMTSSLVALCGFSCLLLSFTDSFRDGNGDVRYGIATFRGLWVIDGSCTISPEMAAGYRIKFIDFMHAFMSILVFAAVALFDQNVVDCFYPAPSDETKELLTVLPVEIGVICSMLFVVFPTKRHGIGFPLSPL
ncbi:PREDICTED: uncharacterized protein LOC104589093 [Nelumbo nucifera]|uniref:Uncharacterized protein LOC104589093 n=2 Tax=Nelumbo nucifera TaxID=4432 RepID=A0A1U7ZDV5_NELNU|nr:PREDICTED: uncharacterized protein LOC104589093 [Nelumbo nucifera]DAD21065.1 TPA_asm: hypothetical protein HUJ06_022528 [Nelumbo nucifera]